MDEFNIHELMNDALKEIERDKFLNVINALMEIISQKKFIQVEELIVYANGFGFSDSEVYLAIDKLKKDGLVEEHGDGYLKRLV